MPLFKRRRVCGVSGCNKGLHIITGRDGNLYYCKGCSNHTCLTRQRDGKTCLLTKPYEGAKTCHVCRENGYGNVRVHTQAVSKPEAVPKCRYNGLYDSRGRLKCEGTCLPDSSYCEKHECWARRCHNQRDWERGDLHPFCNRCSCSTTGCRKPVCLGYGHYCKDCTVKRSSKGQPSW